MPSLSDSFFGSIALKNRVLTSEQLAEAIREQWERAASGAMPTLGEVCCSLGYLEAEQVNAILWAQAKSEVLLEDALVGQIAVRSGLCSEEQLEAALREQRLSRGVPLGDILIARGLITPQERYAIIAHQQRVYVQKRIRPVIMPPERAAEPEVAERKESVRLKRTASGRIRRSTSARLPVAVGPEEKTPAVADKAEKKASSKKTPASRKKSKASRSGRSPKAGAKAKKSAAKKKRR